MAISPFPTVYDVAMQVIPIVPTAVAIPSYIISDVLNRFISGISGLIISPILSAITLGIELLWRTFSTIISGVYQAILNFIYGFIINPLKLLVQNVLNKLYSKLEGVIYIAITVPLMISQAKSLMEKPSFKGAILFAIKPFIGLIVSKIIAEVVKPYLAPVSIAPSVPPSVELMPKPKELNMSGYEYLTIDDVLTIEIKPPLRFIDSISIIDRIAVEALPPMSLLEHIIVNDYLTLSVYPPLSIVDSISIEDYLTIEVI